MARAKEARNHEGKKDILNRAKEHEKARDHAMQQDPWFDYAKGMLQIAIFFSFSVDFRFNTIVIHRWKYFGLAWIAIDP